MAPNHWFAYRNWNFTEPNKKRKRMVARRCLHYFSPMSERSIDIHSILLLIAFGCIQLAHLRLQSLILYNLWFISKSLIITYNIYKLITLLIIIYCNCVIPLLKTSDFDFKNFNMWKFTHSIKIQQNLLIKYMFALAL